MNNPPMEDKFVLLSSNLVSARFVELPPTWVPEPLTVLARTCIGPSVPFMSACSLHGVFADHGRKNKRGAAIKKRR